MNNFEGQDSDNIRKVDSNDFRLQGLRSLQEHELAEGVPDVRGWKVVDRNGDRIGRVDDLIVDPVAQVVRYIDVDLRDSVLPDQMEDKDYHLLIPVGTARLDDDDDVVRAENLSKDQLDLYPRANRGSLDRDYETNVRTFYDNSYRSGGQYFGETRTDDVVGDRQVGSSMGNTMDDVSVSRREHDSDLNEFRNSGTYGNVSNLDTSTSDMDDMNNRNRMDNDPLDVPVTGSTATTVTDSYTISGADRRDEMGLDDEVTDNAGGLNDSMGTIRGNFTPDESTGLDSTTAFRDSDILDSPSDFKNRGIIDGGDNLATGAYGSKFMDEDRNDDKQMRDLNDDRTNSYTDRGDELSDFTENQLRQPGARSNRTEPGTLGGSDFYTDSYFDETRFFGNRFSGQRRGGISTFPEGEGRFTLRRRNI